MDTFGLFVRFTLRDDAGAKFDDLVRQTTAAIRAKEPGTLVYACHTVEDAPNQRIFYELYENHEAFEEHERQPHIRNFLSERSKYVAHTDVDRLTPYAGKHPGEAQ